MDRPPSPILCSNTHFPCKDPTRIRIYEEWEDQAALDAHFAMPHMAAFVEGMGKLTVKYMNVVKFEQGETSPVG